jgi:hypothetical protein
MTDKLEELLARTLRDLPTRRAPGTLEARVLGGLERRAAQPWWRRSFAHWPLSARMALVVVCIGCTGLEFLGSQWTMATVAALTPGNAMALFPAPQALGLLSVATALADVPLRLISPLWLYSGLAAGAVLYVMLFGLGAAAYRTLYLKPLDGR